MAKAIEPSTYRNGYCEPADNKAESLSEFRPENEGHYEVPPSTEILTSVAHNELGLNVHRSWPTLYDGTNSPHPLPKWWRPSSKVDVLICGGNCHTILLAAAHADCPELGLLGYR